MKADELSVQVDKPAHPDWGSDAMADVLAKVGMRYLSLTPGASYRGLHDSVVNYLGNESPQMVLCLHEEHAVAVAHGYAKVTGEPMAVALHSNVGLMHAIMAIYNAYCARVPMLIIGATGPLDASARRPWIDWIHTATDQAALIRNFSKWDDQPGSVSATLDSLVRANAVTRTYPSAPTYVCIDSALQEGPCPQDIAMPDFDRHQPVAAQAPSDSTVDEVIRQLSEAKRPLILAGRVSRSERAWNERVALAEAFGAYVLCDKRIGAAFPTGHPAQPIAPQGRLSAAAKKLVRRADLILALDWVDLNGTFEQAFGASHIDAGVISCSVDFVLHNGWSKDAFGLPPVDLAVGTHPDVLVEGLMATCSDREPPQRWVGEEIELEDKPVTVADGQIFLSYLADSLHRAIGDRSVSFAAVPLGWDGQDLNVQHPLDYLGGDSGGGVGYGPGASVGTALALDGTDRFAIGVLGDGDFLMGSSALWTAAHYELPLLIVVANNRSYYNDEVHQSHMATVRGRATENRWVGQHIRNPDPDLADLARSYGLTGYGPVEDPAELDAVLVRAIKDVEAGKAVVVDVHVGNRGYPGSEAIHDRKIVK